MQVTRFREGAKGPADRLAGFMAHLRYNGIPAGLSETETALEALAAVDAGQPGEVRSALRAICVGDADQERRFDDLFDAYWLSRGRKRVGSSATSAAHNMQARSGSTSRLVSGVSDETGEADMPDDGDEGATGRSGIGRLVASKVTNIEKTDLRKLMTQEDLKRAERVAQQIARSISDGRSRRRKAAMRGAVFDMRKIMRRSVSRGGEPIELFRRKKPDRPVNVVALLDVSGSMTVYARVFLAFLKGLVSADQTTDAYLFHTQLVRISDALRDTDTLRAVNRLSIMAQGFGGGTKIGANLKLFNAQYAAQSVNRRSVVIIMSDGYDTDPPELLAAELARLRRRGARIVWLNPLKGWAGYGPVARGMAAALPYLDHFAAANTLGDLAALEPWLNRI
ncbi:vWA domain-containing protein [Oricola cellulosilytica]|uniref:VWA domain-containing protein n=1 Tax=Oricola cellulosilytica TaxID=1429082 RepID=A0A4V2MN88_9HYPH|nr:VWA domain-containing protein [Oricola cellulosilytica]TCD11838.1 VWA domain-containing protein [Oricola cellulosilytica]